MSRAGVRSFARALRERLESHRVAGWDPPVREPVSPEPAIRSGGAPGTPPQVASESPSSLGGSPEDALATLEREVSGCTRCALHQGRTQTVFGVGAANARLMFVGEGPGAEEDRQGEPFVGPAGQLLNKIIAAMGLQREEVYIANVVKCRPPNNRNPGPDEMGECRGYLDNQVAAVAPEVIVALGSIAARALLGGEQGVGRLRGQFHSFQDVPVMATYHPAYLLREPSQKRKVWEDMQRVMARLALEPPR